MGQAQEEDLLKLGWMSTGRGPGSFELLRVTCENIESGKLDARISCVICSRGMGETEQTDRFLNFVKSKGLPLVSESSSRFRRDYSGDDWRTAFDRLLASGIERFDVDVIFLAGYMLIVSEFLCTRYVLLNLHPALPNGPTGTWQEVMQQLAQTGARSTGAMIHVVTPELDRGPVATYFAFPLAGEPYDALRSSGDTDGLADAIRKQELRREFPLILTTLRSLSAGDIAISEGQVLDRAGRRLAGGMDLSARVERELAQA
jgi:folate-dependent phosphoribosylglycinamide formyltransferase PurN